MLNTLLFESATKLQSKHQHFHGVLIHFTSFSILKSASAYADQKVALRTAQPDSSFTVFLLVRARKQPTVPLHAALRRVRGLAWGPWH